MSRPDRDSPPAWVYLAGGLAAAAVTLLVPPVAFVLHVLRTAVHEAGHAATAWCFGRPALPAFDLHYGGGLTPTYGQSYLLLAVVYAALIWLMVRVRRRRPVLIAVAALTAVHAVLAFTPAHRSVIAFMGHGAELVVAGVFLFRAWTGRATAHAAERFAYAWVGGFLFLVAVRFGWGLAFVPAARDRYHDGKFGAHTNDFDVIAGALRVSVRPVAGLFLLLALATPPAAYAAARLRRRRKRRRADPAPVPTARPRAARRRA